MVRLTPLREQTTQPVAEILTYPWTDPRGFDILQFGPRWQRLKSVHREACGLRSWHMAAAFERGARSDAEVLVDLLQRGGWSVRRSGDTTRLDSNRFRECAVLEVSAKPKER